MDSSLFQIVEKFATGSGVKDIRPLGEGFINDTYIVQTAGDAPDYILQRKNRLVFKNIPGMMDNIQRVCTHMKVKVEAEGGDPDREAMTLIPTLDKELCYLDGKGEYWTLCLLIPDHLCYDRVESPAVAEAGGKGIGKFQRMMSDFGGTLVDTLPGFHNIRYRFEQWDEVLEKDPAGRKGGLAREIGWIERRRGQMLAFYTLVEKGELPCRVTHNDTKISNILFDPGGAVLCVIDLDTVLSSTVLNDFGDAIRSYANTGLEDDRDTAGVSIDLEIFRAFTRGYLSGAGPMLWQTELKYLAFSALYITFEQVLRFLMDFIDGDRYYRISHEGHNLVRARAQYALLRSMEERLEEMNGIVSLEAARG